MPDTRKPHTVIGVFQDRIAAEDAIRDLQDVGFQDNAIGMVARNDNGELVTERAGATMVEEGFAVGVVLGAGVGALVGLGVAAGTIPILGPVLAIGTLATVLLNAAAGATVAGLVGALVGSGIPEEDATIYEKELRGGRLLVIVDADDREAEVRQILRARGAFNPITHPSEPNRGAAGIPPSPRPSNYPAT